jgi:toxin YoeB
MDKVWHDDAWDDYLYWQQHDRRMVKRINLLIKDIERNGNVGVGKPEQLKYDLSKYWSRRIDDEHRLVYHLENNVLKIAQCKGHY